MSSEDRVRRLRELVAKLERMPATPETERMLREVRARVVDVDTGAAPSAMRPAEPALDPTPAPAPSAERKPARRAAPPAAKPSAPAEPAGPSVDQDREWLALFPKNEVLSLGDSPPLPSARPRGKDDRRPWTRGLRG